MSVTPISRLKEKLAKAAGVAQRAATAIEAEADALIAEEDVIKAKTNDAFAPHRAILAEAATELQAIKDVLNLMSNGGPPLEPEAPLNPAVVSAPAIPPPPAPPDVIHDDTGSVEHVTLENGETA